MFSSALEALAIDKVLKYWPASLPQIDELEVKPSQSRLDMG